MVATAWFPAAPHGVLVYRHHVALPWRKDGFDSRIPFSAMSGDKNKNNDQGLACVVRPGLKYPGGVRTPNAYSALDMRLRPVCSLRHSVSRLNATPGAID